VTAIPPRPRLLDAEALPPPPRQKRSQAKRAQLLAAALALFAENGYEATSIGAVARRAGVAVGSFYPHFRTKRQLLLTLMDQLLAGLERLNLQPPGTGSARDTLRTLLHSAFARDLAYAGAYRAWREAILVDVGLAPRQEEIESWTRARLTALFLALGQLPNARRDVNAPVLARLMDRFFWDLLGQALRLPADQLETILECTTDLLFHALFHDAAFNQIQS